MTYWIPGQNKDHYVDYDNKKVIRGNKSFDQLIEDEIGLNTEIPDQNKAGFINAHKLRKAGKIKPKDPPIVPIVHGGSGLIPVLIKRNGIWINA